MLNYELTRRWVSKPIAQRYEVRDTMLYALGIGIGADPVDARQLRFVYEKELVAFPTMSCILASPGFWARDQPELGIDFSRVVHGEQSIVVHASLPSSGKVIGLSRVTRVVDKGPGKGAVIHVEKALSDDAGMPLATVEQILFCRGDGGFSGPDGLADEPAPTSPTGPSTSSSRSAEMVVRADAALLYRLSGDTNALHADPVLAARVGFAKPVLHGLATFGMAVQVLLRDWAEFDERYLRAVRARLSAPVFPGETLRVASWEVPDGVAFQVRVVERDVLALDHGFIALATPPHA